MRLISGLVFALGLGLLVSPRVMAAEDEYAAVRDKLKACFACHGVNGAPQDPQFPIIAGQHLYYIYVQLHVTPRRNGYFNAYDSATGNLLWKFQAGAGVNAPPVSYTVGGKQYIAVAAGGNVQLNYKRGNSIIAFTLGD